MYILIMLDSSDPVSVAIYYSKQPVIHEKISAPLGPLRQLLKENDLLKHLIS